jgi:hypothetical protein
MKNLFKIILILCVPIVSTAQEQPNDDPEWTSHWIWTSADGPSNTWVSMRKKVSLTSKPTRAITKIAAENKYWLYVNNKIVVSDGGLDIRPDFKNTYYDEVDLAPHLEAGDNIIAVLVWNKGGDDAYSQKTVDKGGFLFDSKLEGTNLTSIVSDNTWKVQENPAFLKGSFFYKYGVSGTITFDNATFGGDPLPRIAKKGYYRPVGSTDPFIQCADEDQSFTLPGVCDVAYGSKDNQFKPWGDYKWIAFPVSYDARNEIQGWQSLSFNDASWTNAVTKGIPPVAPWHNLMHRTIPMWKDHGLNPYLNQLSLPASVSSNTTIIGQLGVNIQGTPYLKVNAPSGVRIRIVLNEYYWQEYVTKAGVQEFECYAWQNSSGHTVRYEFSNVTGTVSIMDLKFRRTGYDTEVIGTFSSNDPALNTLWEKSKNTSEVCMRDIFYDCPDRERGQWWGDVSEQILYSFYLYDDKSNLLAKKAYRELLNTQKSDGSLYTTAPGDRFHLPDQNIAAMATLWTYYQYTGDKELMEELYPQMKKFIQYCVNTSNSDGMLIVQPGSVAWNWIDWGGNMDIKEGSANTIVNASYIVLLDGMINIAALLGAADDKTYFRDLQSKIKNNFNNYFWNGSSYAFHNMNGQKSAIIDDRTQAWAVLAGMVDDSKKAGVLNILKARNDASPYQEMYIEKAMLQLDAVGAINRMKNRYTPMINNWSSTLWEEFPASGSNNHAWAAGPVYLFGGYVLGIRPSQKAYDEFVFLPQPGNFKTLSANVPSPKGLIEASYSSDNSVFTQKLTSPSNTVAIVGIPKQNSAGLEVRIDNTVIWQNGTVAGDVAGVNFYKQDAQFVMFKVQPGSWVFTSVLEPGATLSVKITSPATNSFFTNTQVITVSADATTFIGTVDKVEFYDGTVLLGSDNNAPYQFGLQNLTVGRHSITAVVIDDQNVRLSSQPVVLNISAVTGVDDLTNKDTIHITPNPTGHYLHVSSSKDLSNAKIRIFDAQGRLLSQPLMKHDGIYVGDLPSGLYLIEITEAKNKSVYRFVRK